MTAWPVTRALRLLAPTECEGEGDCLVATGEANAGYEEWKGCAQRVHSW